MAKIIGDFGEDKDKAREIRTKKIIPALTDEKEVVLDFENVSGVTQSFMHALIVAPIWKFESTFFEKVTFKNCSEQIKQIVRIVSDYTQES